MKKIKQIVAVLLLLVISNIILPTVANASDTDTLFDGQYYQIEQKNNTIYILDKETNVKSHPLGHQTPLKDGILLSHNGHCKLSLLAEHRYQSALNPRQ